jgi:hypothetical protein
MPAYLTPAATMMCPHGGTVLATPTSASVQAGGGPVLTSADTFVIAGCPFMIAMVPSPCISVQWLATATASTRGGAPTLTVASTALCLAATQAPQGPLVITPGQAQAGGT